MPRVTSQMGLTTIGGVLVLGLVSFGLFLILKIAPVYIESYAVSDAIASLKKDPELRARSRHELYNLLIKRFDINDVNHITARDIQSKVKINKTAQGFQVTVDYEVIVPLSRQISLLFDIRKDIDI